MGEALEPDRFWKYSVFGDEGWNFDKYVYKMGGSVRNSRCTLSAFLSVAMGEWFAQEFRGFYIDLQCSGVSWMLVEVDCQIFGRWFLSPVEERSGKKIHNSPCCVWSQRRYDMREVVEAKFRRVLTCIGDSVATWTFREGWRESFVCRLAQLECSQCRWRLLATKNLNNNI